MYKPKQGCVLLLNPPYYDAILANSRGGAAVSKGVIPLGLASVAAPLLQAGKDVTVVDLNLADDPDAALHNALIGIRPEIVGITATTPLIHSAYSIARKVKQCCMDSLVVIGGPHASAMPEAVLLESDADVAVCGEGDFTLLDIVNNGLTETTPNVLFKRNGSIIRSSRFGQPIADLDGLPFPAFRLFDTKNYHLPSIISRRSPVARIETSRGCYESCVYCHKNDRGYSIRYKTPARVVDEMEQTLSLGFRELHIIDDNFTADMERAYAICEEILRRGLKFPWCPRGGVRVDRVTSDLLAIMKRAGCYRIPFGVESGSERVLDVIRKRISLSQVANAMQMAKKAGLETECFFMLGLPTETEDDIKKTIQFAIRLDPDFARFAVAIPLPGTPMFEEMSKRGQILTKDWSKFNYSSVAQAYRHDCLSSEQLDQYNAKCHREFYLRPSYMLKMLFKTFRNRTLWDHIRVFIQTKW